jgi:hypothetical protein
MLLLRASTAVEPLGSRSPTRLVRDRFQNSGRYGLSAQLDRSTAGRDSEHAETTIHGQCVTACLRLMGKKLLVALTMEGKFAGEGLQSIDEDDDMLSAMARELVERNGVGESADAVWRALNREHQKLFPTASEPEDEGASPELSANVRPGDFDARVLGEELIDSSSVLVFGQRPGSGRRTRSKPSVPEQASLFG